ncbi:hypothetical protein A2U01_0090454, partial [Trifolium medium]|nr:hypothetical protein [Trifolium medium]
MNSVAQGAVDLCAGRSRQCKNYPKSPANCAGRSSSAGVVVFGQFTVQA